MGTAGSIRIRLFAGPPSSNEFPFDSFDFSSLMNIPITRETNEQCTAFFVGRLRIEVLPLLSCLSPLSPPCSLD